jgi:hypothetical protein
MADPVPEGVSPQVPFGDLRFVIWCRDCRVHDVARCIREGTAVTLQQLHEANRPGHRAEVRDLYTEDVPLP